jgi:hypothetical protein
MATTVNGAFAIFLRDTVNLDKDQTTRARGSRDWLLGEIKNFSKDDTFPKFYAEKDLHYGSFARKTKIRPLDDIDLMICLSGQGGTYREWPDRTEITVNPDSNLRHYCNDNSVILNSIKVINKFKSNLQDIPQYVNADIKRNQEAVTLSLKSYPWIYDIVPCFYTTPTSSGIEYYLIPDGKGNWKFTDPRIDRDRTQRVNSEHNGRILEVIRIIKYWNQHAKMPCIPSYQLETMILDYYDSVLDRASQYVDVEVPKVLGHIGVNIYYNISDPKNIQGKINNLSEEDRQKISEKARSDRDIANEARVLENQGDHKRSINKWREIFGDQFPPYE